MVQVGTCSTPIQHPHPAMSQGPAPAAGYIAFVLLGVYPSGFYLNIPLDILRSIAAPGRVSKFLRYLAWEILYCDGIVIQVCPGLDVDRVMQDDDDVEDEAVYVFRPNPDGKVLLMLYVTTFLPIVSAYIADQSRRSAT